MNSANARSAVVSKGIFSNSDKALWYRSCAFCFAPLNPSNLGYVLLSKSRSAPTCLPISALSPSISKISSWTWKAKPMASAYCVKDCSNVLSAKCGEQIKDIPIAI